MAEGAASDERKRVGKYVILAKIGEGGMGSVYLAEDPVLERKVAMKVLPPKLVQNEEYLKRFYAEARNMAKLDHPNITTLHDAGEYDGYHILAMEYVEGPTLDKMMKEGELPPLEALLRMMAAVASGLQHAHEKEVVHRDIKPDNILVNPEGKPMLCDFGLAIQSFSDPLTKEGIIVGTPYYVSPEQCRSPNIGPAADIYSFGATMYHVFSGQVVFDGKTVLAILNKAMSEPPDLSPLQKRVPEYVVSIVARCLQKKPEDRYASADELRRALEAAVDHLEMAASETIELAPPREGQTLLLHVEYTEGGLPGSYRQYEVGPYLGGGAYGQVYRAVEKLSGREVALKILRREHLAAPDTVARFRREATLLSRLAHPNILKVHNFGRYGPTFFIAMDLLPGPTLAEVMDEHGPMEPAEAARLAAGVLTGLAAVHEAGVMHRDLKPGNLAAADDRVVVFDFNLARSAEMSRLTMTGDILGTPAYMAPEQAKGLAATPASDVYSAGVVLYEMLSGRLPHEADSEYGMMHRIATEPPVPICEHRPDLPGAVTEVLGELLAADPAERPTAAEAAAELASAAGPPGA